MKETIIFAPGLSGMELLRSLAKFGINTFGYRVMNAVDLSRMAFMKSGIALTAAFLPRKDEPAVIDSILRDIPYFKSASYADAESMAAALYTLRSLIPEEEPATIHKCLPQGEFPEKNEALVHVYDRYMEQLLASGRIDTVGVIRRALAEAKELSGKTEILTLKEYPLTPLEQKLAGVLSAGLVREISLTDLFRTEKKPLHDLTFSKCYGASNEVRDIISYIYQNGIPLDHCTVAVAETLVYAELFEDIAAEYDLPVSFGCGLPITVSNPARLLKLYQAWNTTGFRGIDALEDLIMSSAFDRKHLSERISPQKPIGRDDWKKIIKAAGSLRLSAKKEDNLRKLEDYESYIGAADYRKEEDREDARVILGIVRTLAFEMEQGAAYLLGNYSKIRTGTAGRIDRSAVNVITGMIDAYLRLSNNSDIDGIIPAILNKTVSSENSREGCLHVCGISGAMAVPREHLFIAGLSASNFPGSPAENYLLLDSDLALFGTGSEVPVSSERIRRKKQVLSHLLDEASSLDLKIRLSYSSYDLAELKEENPSSVLQEIFHEAYPDADGEDAFDEAFRQVSFFDDRISRHTAVGTAYMKGSSILIGSSADQRFADKETLEGTATLATGNTADVTDTGHVLHADEAVNNTSASTYTSLLERAWSPSAIDVFFECPRKFYLTRILRIEEPEPDDPFEVINAKENGTMAHSLMELLGRDHLSEDDFLKKAEEAFDQFLKSRPPVHDDDGEREEKQFLRMMKNAWEQDPGFDIALSEEEKKVMHPSGITLKGIPDRVEKTEDGRYRIIDFKTGRRVTHKPDDIETCLQVLIYAFMMEQEGLDITGCEYRYLRNRQTVSCRYDAEMKDQLHARLTEFKEALLSGDFPCKPGDDHCRFCRLDTVCGKERNAEDGEDGDE